MKVASSDWPLLPSANAMASNVPPEMRMTPPHNRVRRIRTVRGMWAHPRSPVSHRGALVAMPAPFVGVDPPGTRPTRKGAWVRSCPAWLLSCNSGATAAVAPLLDVSAYKFTPGPSFLKPGGIRVSAATTGSSRSPLRWRALIHWGDARRGRHRRSGMWQLAERLCREPRLLVDDDNNTACKQRLLTERQWSRRLWRKFRLPNIRRSGWAGSAFNSPRCMRTHGMPNFPDPNGQGQVQMSGVNPQSPSFEAAQRACAKYSPNGGKPPTAAQQQQAEAQALKFSECMRSHGISDFPDPQVSSSGGHVSIGIRISAGKSSDLNPNSPQFQAAQKACQSLAPFGKGLPTATKG